MSGSPMSNSTRSIGVAGLPGTERFERLSAGGRLDHVMAFGGQVLIEHPPDARLVIDHQHCSAHAPILTSAG